MQRETYSNREQWLERRRLGLGASEAATAVSINLYSSRESLMNIKLGKEAPPDLSNKPSVQRGIKLEPILRELFKATHDDMDVEYYPYDILYQEECPWRFATLDGEIKRGDERGILEIKTAEPKGKAAWESWNNKIPDYYYAQVLHQLLATGYDFVILLACIFTYDGDMVIREYEIPRSECLEDMSWVKKEEESFWKELEERKNEN